MILKKKMHMVLIFLLPKKVLIKVVKEGLNRIINKNNQKKKK